MNWKQLLGWLWRTGVEVLETGLTVGLRHEPVKAAREEAHSSNSTVGDSEQVHARVLGLTAGLSLATRLIDLGSMYTLYRGSVTEYCFLKKKML